MAGNFADVFSFAAYMAMRDYNKEKNRLKEKQANFQQKCIEKIADATGDLFDLLINFSKEANPEYIPNEIGEGALNLAAYAMFRVLEAQGGNPTKEQDKFLNVYFNNMKIIGYGKYDFLASLRANNSTRQKIESLVSISDTFCGTFWQTFFKMMYKMNSDEKLLITVIDKFSDIVVHFSILGNPDSDVDYSICENFVKAVEKQVTACRNLPEDEFDFLGEITYEEHYQRARNIAEQIVSMGDPDDEVVTELFVYFSVGLIYSFIERCNRKDEEKAVMFSNIINNLGIDLEEDGCTLYNMISQDGQMRSLTYDMVNNWHNGEVNYWKIVDIAARKSDNGELTIDFVTECSNFLMGLESEMAKEYPFSGFGSIGRDYIMGTAQKLANMYS